MTTSMADSMIDYGVVQAKAITAPTQCDALTLPALPFSTPKRRRAGGVKILRLRSNL